MYKGKVMGEWESKLQDTQADQSNSQYSCFPPQASTEPMNFLTTSTTTTEQPQWGSQERLKSGSKEKGSGKKIESFINFRCPTPKQSGRNSQRSKKNIHPASSNKPSSSVEFLKTNSINDTLKLENKISEETPFSIFETREIVTKIDQLVENMRKMDKRVYKLQHQAEFSYNCLQGRNENSLNISNIDQKTFLQDNQFFEPQKLKQEIQNIKFQLENCIKREQTQHLTNEQLHQSSLKESQVATQQKTLTALKKQQQKSVSQLFSNIQQKLQQQFAELEEKAYQSLRNLSRGYKPSPIKCSNSAILLRFVETFKVRKNITKKTQSKIVLTDNTYYIDSQGYLLDRDQYYLVDIEGNRVRLEQRHIQLLKQEQVLQ